MVPEIDTAQQETVAKRQALVKNLLDKDIEGEGVDPSLTEIAAGMKDPEREIKIASALVKEARRTGTVEILKEVVGI